MIASTAAADKNSLDTGTLGFSDIVNKADYKVSHAGASISGGGDIGGKEFTGNMAGGMASALSHSGHAEGSTQAAVSNGTITIRDTARQQQDVADLSRDTEYANDSISPIFDKEKEQKRLQSVQLVQDIGSQASDIARTQGQLAGLAAQKDPDALDNARAQLLAEHKTVTDEMVSQRAYDNAMQQYGTGSDIQRAIQGVTAGLSGLAGGNIAGALAGASAPELANLIGHGMGIDENDHATKALAHAILGGVVASLQGNSTTAGAMGGASGELVAAAIANALYPGQKPAELSEEQKQTVSALASVSAGIAGGLTGDSASGAAAGAQAGKNTVENNYLSVSEKTELEIAKQKLNSKDPAEREKAQQTINELREKDIASDQKVIDACGNGNADSAACAGARLEVIAAKGEYESIGNYNSKASQQYADAYGQIVNLLNITSVDAQNQQQVKDAMVNYAMVHFGVDKATAENYVETYDGMKTVAASMAPLLGAAAVTKIDSIVANYSKANQLSTGTVFDSIKATQPVHPGSVIPQSFEMSLPNGQKIWVHGNATEHMAEYAASKAVTHTPEAVRLASQEELRSFQAAVNTATKTNMPYGERITVDGWQLEIKPPRVDGELPTIIHARYLGSH